MSLRTANRSSREIAGTQPVDASPGSQPNPAIRVSGDSIVDEPDSSSSDRSSRRDRGALGESRISQAMLNGRSVSELIRYASDLSIPEPRLLSREDLVLRIIQKHQDLNTTVVGEGVLEVMPSGNGFLRQIANDLLPGNTDIYVSQSQIRRFRLRTGHEVCGTIRPPRGKEHSLALLEIARINGEPAERVYETVAFDELTPIFPEQRFVLEQEKQDISMRVLDLVAPIGKGQRGLIVAPAKAGKTVLLQQIAQSVAAGHPDCMLMVLLIDERPAEVTEMKRSVRGEVFASTFDQSASRHCRVAEMVIELAKRRVEYGRDVVILLDSITRLARAYNKEAPASGRVLTGGLEANALERPKRFFGAARNIENGGSLTILGTALVDTNSKMDDHIYEEFKGTGDMEVHLDRRLMHRRLFPAIDIHPSGTRREELLVHPDELPRLWQLRKSLSEFNTIEAAEHLIERIKRTRNNIELVLEMK